MKRLLILLGALSLVVIGAPAASAATGTTPVQGAQVVAVTTNSAVVVWQPPEQMTAPYDVVVSYEVTLDDPGPLTGLSNYVDVNQANLSAAMKGLTPGTSHTVTVWTVDLNLVTRESWVTHPVSVDFTTDQALPPAVFTPPAPVAAPKVVSAKHYANCTAMHKVYKGGVSKSAKVKNKGGKTKYKPHVSLALYNANKGLDRDHDGIACEA